MIWPSPTTGKILVAGCRPTGLAANLALKRERTTTSAVWSRMHWLRCRK